MRVKLMRKTRSEKNMLNNFLKEHAYRLYQTSSPGSNITTHPLRNIKDVSIGRMVLHSTLSCSSLALGLIWRSWWDVGVGLPAGARNTGKQGPYSEESTLSSSTVDLCDWAWQLPGGR